MLHEGSSLEKNCTATGRGGWEKPAWAPRVAVVRQNCWGARCADSSSCFECNQQIVFARIFLAGEVVKTGGPPLAARGGLVPSAAPASPSNCITTRSQPAAPRWCKLQGTCSSPLPLLHPQHQPGVAAAQYVVEAEHHEDVLMVVSNSQ